tara:strand:- start:1856 stop:2293 length:438 start_codon:yes stop_codon:yes gene_type:complete
MKEVLKTKGGIAAWDLLNMSNSILEAITYCEEIEPGDRIGFFPNDTIEHNSLYQQIKKLEPNFPTKDCPHHGGVKVEIVTSKGVGYIDLLLDMNDLFSYQYVQRGVQLDYGRFYRGEMHAYLVAVSRVLNSPKALKERKLIKKEE